MVDPKPVTPPKLRNNSEGGQGESNLKTIVGGMGAQQAVEGALARLKSSERPNLTTEQRQNLINGAWQRLSAGETLTSVRDGITAAIRAEQKSQGDARAKDEAAAKTAPISTAGTAPAATGAAPTDPNNPYGVSWSNGRPSFSGGQGQGKQMSMAQGWNTLVRANLDTMPQAKDPQYKGDLAAYRADMDEWQKSTIEAQQNARLSQQLELGILEMPDGTLMDVHDPAVERDPQLQAAMATFWTNQDNNVRDAYSKQLNELDLGEYNAAVSATNANNANLSRSFQDALGLVHERVSIGQANQDTAVKEINRLLGGQQESRLRAGQAETELSAAAGMASPEGKTSFSANDLGGAQAALSRFAGLDPAANLLNFTGQRTVDPLGMMGQLDKAAGVDRALPEIPGLGVTAGDLPNAPAYAGVGGPPTLRRPTAPVLPNRPAPGPSLLALQSVADQQ